MLMTGFLFFSNDYAVVSSVLFLMLGILIWGIDSGYMIYLFWKKWKYDKVTPVTNLSA